MLRVLACGAQMLASRSDAREHKMGNGGATVAAKPTAVRRPSLFASSVTTAYQAEQRAGHEQDQEYEEQDLREIPTAPAAIPPKPKTAATTAIRKKASA